MQVRITTTFKAMKVNYYYDNTVSQLTIKDFIHGRINLFSTMLKNGNREGFNAITRNPKAITNSKNLLIHLKNSK